MSNREIKFRAWDKITKQIVPVWNIGWKAWDNSGVINTVIIELDGTIERSEHEVELMQFTGRKDVKNKDIYEGDVFRQEEELENGNDRITYLVVMWLPQRAAFYLIDVSHYYILPDVGEEDDSFSWLFDQAALYDFSIDSQLKSGVIGNIYENPKYLEDENL